MPQPQLHFAFGKAWANFLVHLNNDGRIWGACHQMQTAIGDLHGKYSLPAVVSTEMQSPVAAVTEV